MKTDHSVALRFDRAATAYDAEAAGQRAAADLLIEALPSSCAPKTILEIGCGTGILTERIRERFPEAHIDAFDIAPGMVQATQAKLQDYPSLRVSLADARTYTPPKQTYDLILSASVLHWIDPVTPLLQRLLGGLHTDGMLGVSVMLQDTWKPLHDARKIVAPNAPPQRALAPASLWLTALNEAGWHTTTHAENHLAQHWPDARHFLRAAHQLGVTGGELSHGHAAALSRSQLRGIEAVLDASPDGCMMTYHTGLFLAQIDSAFTPAN